MATSVTARERRRTALRAAWLFDGTADRLVPDPLVLIEGRTITEVSFGGSPPEDADVVELPGATLMPGLVDTHVHLAFDASMDAVASLAARDDEQAFDAMREAGRAALRGGVTTVRDLGDRSYLSLKLRDSGAADVPTIVAAGPPITTPEGHCYFLGGAAAPGPEGVRAAVREHAERGVDVIKFMASGGTMTPGTKNEDAQFSFEELRAGVDEAHRLGLPVTAHAHGEPAIVAAVDAGVDGMEHVSFWTEEGIAEPPAELLERIARARIVIGLTLGMVDVGLPPPPEILTRLPAIVANMGRFRAAGLRCVVGSDAGIAPPKPPDVLRYAPPMAVSAGFSPAEVLRMITADAAEAVGLGGSKGRLAAGYEADVLAVDGDPFGDLSSLHRIKAVFARGRRIR